MRDRYYVLENGQPVSCSSHEWSRWFEGHDRERVVAKTGVGSWTVSTVFLGLDHQWGDGPPLIYETLVIEGPLGGEMERYSTLEQAQAGHGRMVRRVEYARAATFASETPTSG